MKKVNGGLIIVFVVAVFMLGSAVMLGISMFGGNNKNVSENDTVENESEETCVEDEYISDFKSTFDESDPEFNEGPVVSYSVEELRQIFNNDFSYTVCKKDESYEIKFTDNPNEVVIYKDGNLVTNFIYRTSVEDWYFTVYTPLFSDENLLLISCSVAAYCDFGFIENNKFHRIKEYELDDPCLFEYKGYIAENYEMLAGNDEIRVCLYAYNPHDSEDIQIKGFNCKLQTNTETKEHSFTVEEYERSLN
ncbi:MAG: hypothetical protein KBS84_10170 [Treponema sp.]|nr:hypothetical protein [Candidatus Treponema scatequi]